MLCGIFLVSNYQVSFLVLFVVRLSSSPTPVIPQSPNIPILLQEAVSGDPATYLDQFVPDSVDKEAEVALTTATTWSQDTSRDKGET